MAGTRRVAIVLIALIVWQCASSSAFAAAIAPSRPVIVIPGTLGTKLCTAGPPAVSVWPSDSTTGFPNLKALRMGLSANARTELRPCGLLDRFATFFQLWDVSVYGPLLEFLEKQLHYPKAQVFVFTYDWRLSTFDNARRLGAYVETVKQRSRSRDVDILAHSMGGIITRIYLQSHAGAPSVAHAVFLGVPHRQTVQPLKSGVFGWRTAGAVSGSCSAAAREGILGDVSGGISDFFGGIAGDLATQDAGSEAEIRESVFSWPSTYELLSLENCCTLKTRGADAAMSLSNPEAWARLPWLPKGFRDGGGARLSAEFRAFLALELRRSGELRALLRRPLPQGPKYGFVASQDHSTIGRVLFDSRFRISGFKAACGDGTVTVASAANGDIANARLVSAPHATIFNDRQALTYIAVGLDLVDQLDVATAGPPLAIGFYRSCTGEAIEGDDAEQRIRREAVFFRRSPKGDAICLRSIALAASPARARVSEPASVRVRVGGYRSLWRSELNPTLEIVDQSGAVVAELAPASSTIYSRDGAHYVDFNYTFRAPAPGVFRAQIGADSLAEEKDRATFTTTIEIAED